MISDRLAGAFVGVMAWTCSANVTTTGVSTATMELLRSWGLEGEVRAGQLALDATDGFATDQLTHCLQTATRAERLASPAPTPCRSGTPTPTCTP